MRTLHWLLVLILVTLAGGLFALGRASAQNRVAPPLATAGSGFDLKDLDPTCQPCQDFFQYATGGWKKRNPIGPAYATWERFSQLQERNLIVLRGILESALRTASARIGVKIRRV